MSPADDSGSPNSAKMGGTASRVSNGCMSGFLVAALGALSLGVAAPNGAVAGFSSVPGAEGDGIEGAR